MIVFTMTSRTNLDPFRTTTQSGQPLPPGTTPFDPVNLPYGGNDFLKSTPKPPAGMTFALDGRRHHKLMDAASVRALPPIMSQESKPETEKYAPVKLFCPYNGQRWYLLEFDPETAQAFCFTTTENNAPEYCYVSVRDLGQAAGMRGALPLVERDLHYTPLTIAQIKAGAY